MQFGYSIAGQHMFEFAKPKGPVTPAALIIAPYLICATSCDICRCIICDFLSFCADITNTNMKLQIFRGAQLAEKTAKWQTALEDVASLLFQDAFR